jgi:phosphatidylglycerol:prolipoprotein diacylglycerol transferase
MYIVAFAIGWMGARARAKRAGSPVTVLQVDDLVFYVMLGVILGGRIGYMLFYGLGSFVQNPLSMFRIWDGGMSFHGGLLGVLVAMWIYARSIGQPFFSITDFMVVWVPIGLGLGRIGNFINGELWGKATTRDFPLSFVVGDEVLHPSQLYEAFLEGLVLFVVLFFASKKPRSTALLSGLFLVLYGVFRCAIEFIRVPDDGIYLAFDWLTKGQVLSAPMIVAGVIIVALSLQRKFRRAAVPT